MVFCADSNSQMAEILSTSTAAPNFVLKLDSDEEISQSSSETSLVI